MNAAAIPSYQETYPHVAIVAELRKAQRWLLDNADRRKTARGMPRFINGWLARQENHRPMQGGRRQSDPVRGSTCPHDPMCGSNTECIARVIEDSRRARKAS